MNRVKFLPSVADRIQEIICENNVVTPVTLIDLDGEVYMEFETALHGRSATVRLIVFDGTNRHKAGAK